MRNVENIVSSEDYSKKPVTLLSLGKGGAPLRKSLLFIVRKWNFVWG